MMCGTHEAGTGFFPVLVHTRAGPGRGVAEFMRLYLTNTVQAARLAPAITGPLKG
ncbi:hypothetical protein [Desulforamulus ruminis]|nr:hypothetical protein [Desulforamulus ruminis]